MHVDVDDDLGQVGGGAVCSARSELTLLGWSKSNDLSQPTSSPKSYIHFTSNTSHGVAPRCPMTDKEFHRYAAV